MGMSRFLLALALVAGADAYLLAPMRPTVAMRAAVPTMAVEQAVADCLESGCSIDDVSILIDELKQTSLEQKDGSLNKAPSKNQGELEKIIAGMGRSFGTVEAFDFPGEPLGYSGVPGSTTTAGKALD